MSVKELLFCNLQLLGCSISKDAFVYANEREFQRITHFLFTAFDGKLCQSNFSRCWPITDNKAAAEFRRVTIAWLKEMKQNDPDCSIPAINMGLLVSPGGWKIYEFFLAFSKHVMFKSIQKISPLKHIISVGAKSMPISFLKAAIDNEKSDFMSSEQNNVGVLEEYQTYSSKFSCKYRLLKTECSMITEDLNNTVDDINKDLGDYMKVNNALDVSPLLDSLNLACAQSVKDIHDKATSINTIESVLGEFSSAAESLMESTSNVDDEVKLGTTLDASQLLSHSKSSDAVVDGKLDLIHLFDLASHHLDKSKQCFSENSFPNLSETSEKVATAEARTKLLLSEASAVSTGILQEKAAIDSSIRKYEEMELHESSYSDSQFSLLDMLSSQTAVSADISKESAHQESQLDPGTSLSIADTLWIEELNSQSNVSANSLPNSSLNSLEVSLSSFKFDDVLSIE